MPMGKREPPAEVKPVTIGRTRFEAIHWGKERGLDQNGGYIAAYNADTGEELWTLKIYHTEYDPDLEEDVQDVFIEKMTKTFLTGKLKITDERGREYVVDTKNRKVTAR